MLIDFNTEIILELKASKVSYFGMKMIWLRVWHVTFFLAHKCYLTIRLRARDFYEVIVDEGVLVE